VNKFFDWLEAATLIMCVIVFFPLVIIALGCSIRTMQLDMDSNWEEGGDTYLR
jgi:hypothetical protein